jgi:hypothetical protein
MNVTERLDELAKIISDLMADTAERKDPEAFLEIAIATRQLFRAVPGAEKQMRSALYSIENALSLLIDMQPAVDVSEIKQACSFCDKQAPEVRLGAGHSAFICNECVDLFTEVFRLEKKDGSAKG